MKYDNEILKVLHEGAIDKFKAGVITEARMREYDEMCLTKPKPVKKPAPVYKKEKSVTMRLSPNTL